MTEGKSDNTPLFYPERQQGSNPDARRAWTDGCAGRKRGISCAFLAEKFGGDVGLVKQTSPGEEPGEGGCGAVGRVFRRGSIGTSQKSPALFGRANPAGVGRDGVGAG